MGNVKKWGKMGFSDSWEKNFFLKKDPNFWQVAKKVKFQNFFKNFVKKGNWYKSQKSLKKVVFICI